MKYRQNRLDPIAQDKLDRAIYLAERLSSIISEVGLGTGRPQSLALTKLQECLMWIQNGLQDEMESRPGSMSQEP